MGLCSVLGYSCLSIRRSIRQVLSSPDAPWPERLRILLCGFRCISVVERWIEGRHAQIKQFLRAAPHHGPMYVAWAWGCVANDVADSLAEAPERIKDLAVHCKAARRPSLAIKELGFQRHPGIIKLSLQGTRRLNRDSAKESGNIN